MSGIIYLVFLFTIKIILIKIINQLTKKLDILHSYSTFFPIIFFLTINFFYLKLDTTLVFKIVIIYIVYSYIFITIPGGFASSVRLKILSHFIYKNGLKSTDLFKKINDEVLFENRFKRLIKYSIIRKNQHYFIKSNKIKFFLNFIKLNKKIFNIIQRH